MKTLLFCFLTLLAIGCSSDNDAELFNPQNIEPTFIGKGFVNLSHDFDDQNRVITNNTQWQELMSQLNAARGGITENFTETTIDFSAYDVIASFIVSNSTTTIDITNVTENEHDVTVTLQNLQHGLTQDVVQPFHIIKIQKRNKPIVFNDETGQ